MLAHVERVQVRVRLLWPAISGLVSRRCSWRLTLALTLTLTQVLVAYDRNSDGLLSLTEFGELVHRMQAANPNPNPNPDPNPNPNPNPPRPTRHSASTLRSTSGSTVRARALPTGRPARAPSPWTGCRRCWRRMGRTSFELCTGCPHVVCRVWLGVLLYYIVVPVYCLLSNSPSKVRTCTPFPGILIFSTVKHGH